MRSILKMSEAERDALSKAEFRTLVLRELDTLDALLKGAQARGEEILDELRNVREDIGAVASTSG